MAAPARGSRGSAAGEAGQRRKRSSQLIRLRAPRSRPLREIAKQPQSNRKHKEWLASIEGRARINMTHAWKLECALWNLRCNVPAAHEWLRITSILG
jgi:hypothetical protein